LKNNSFSSFGRIEAEEELEVVEGGRQYEKR
jgi:hypothetical protein